MRLRGIKTFQKERIDLAILYAASILVEGCDTLRDIFLGVVEGKRDMLYPVENLVTEVGYGFLGWIDNNRVIVGSREMMARHDIEIPSMDYEKRYTGDDKQPIYLAVAGRLFGMFLVSYGPDEDMAETVEELRHAGISLLVKSSDFNVTSELVAALLRRQPRKRESALGRRAHRPHSLAVLPARERGRHDPHRQLFVLYRRPARGHRRRRGRKGRRHRADCGGGTGHPAGAAAVGDHGPGQPVGAGRCCCTSAPG